MECNVPRNVQRTIEIKCWIDGFDLDLDLMNGKTGKNISNYGVGPMIMDGGKNFIHISYYQWVGPIFVAMARILSIPYGFYLTHVDKHILDIAGKYIDRSDALLTNDAIFSLQINQSSIIYGCLRGENF